MRTTLALLVLTIVSFAHGEDPPPWFLDPDSIGVCNQGARVQLIYDYGTQPLMPFPSTWYYEPGGWGPYQIMNGQGTPLESPCESGFFGDKYLSAGNIGELVCLTVQTQSPSNNDPFPDGAVAWTTFADGWTDPYYSPYGWTMLTGNVVNTWVYGDHEKLYHSVGGYHYGWRRYTVWPNDPELAGLRLVYQSFVHDPDGGETRFSAVWLLTFVDPNNLP